jgi:hypothetical protein
LNEQEKQYLIQQLEVCEGKINLVARSAGIDVKTLYRKMRQHGLDKRFFKQQGQKDTLDGRETHANGSASAENRSQHLSS